MAIASAEENLTRLLNNYKSYKANFSQVNYGEKNRVLQRSDGQVFMLRPGRFRWETKHPYPQIVIANGNSVWIYDVSLKQATQQSLTKHGFNPGELLTSPAIDLARKFVVTQEADGWFKLVPKQANGGFHSAYMQFKQNQLTGLKIINQLNQTNIFHFHNIQVNTPLSPQLFNFRTPQGVDVLRQ